MEFHELAEMCKGRMRLMLDVKEEPQPPEYYRLLQDALEKNDLMSSTYILSGSDVEGYFRGKLPAAADDKALREAVSRGENVSHGYYLFEGAKTITPEAIAFAREKKVEVVVAANTFGYKGSDGMNDARTDLLHALALGVTTFQVDSVYDRWLLRM
jgi:hypothetical protein